ncbi:Pentatricopeptide repeat-containing protein [Quillaja saponaria]|uniref:Pentatricopeptide repeat-containing protein n=1 Tax=Quillaja saponaria TaxID=32244 RepID=A0AAD7PQM7_QUISA|nr:Pentatricopeptide repeat-containing protein [Quillaja saponaria]
MSLLRIFPHKTLNSLSILTVTNRFLTTQNPYLKPISGNPTSAHYDELVNIAGRSRDFETLIHLLNKRFKDGCFNTANTFKFITDDHNSLSILDDLSQSLARLNRGFARKSAYDSLIARLCKLNLFDESLRVVEAMARSHGGLNACTFHPILNSLTKKKNIDEAWRVIDLMRSLNVSPDVTAYNYFLMAECTLGNITTAAEILVKMEEEGMRADTRTYDALVVGACAVGKVRGALVLLSRMVDDGVPVLFSTHAYVINALLKCGYYAQAVKFVMCYSGIDTLLETESFGVLANRLIKLNRFEEAKLVLNEMTKRGLAMGDKLKDFYDLNVKNVFTAHPRPKRK